MLVELDVLEAVPCELKRTENRRVSVVTKSASAEGQGSCDNRRGRRGRRPEELTGNGGNFRRSRGKRAALSDTNLRWPNTTISPQQIAYTMNRDAYGDYLIFLFLIFGY